MLSLGLGGQGILFFGCHVDHMVHYTVSIAKLIAIPRNDLDRVAVEAMLASASKIEELVSLLELKDI
jgi:hypothetical protein